MKKIISIITFLTLIITCAFSLKVDATDLADSKLNIDVKTDKSIVLPGQTVTLTAEFEKPLGTYTIKVAYDKNIFEYASVVGGTANDLGDRVNVVFHDETGGTSPRNSMSITFKAKEDLLTSNPTEFTLTAEGLANADASKTYDDITTPIVKNVTVEPKYEEYRITLERPEKITKGKETEMKISYSSAMGRFYEHARLVAEVTTPKGATVKLLGTDTNNLEHDIIQSGWGDPQGYKIGGKNFEQILNVRGLFSEVGSYAITLNLIDRDNTDRAIASGTFLINVTEEGAESNQTPVGEIKNTTTNTITNTATKKPQELPKTGTNIYIPVSIAIIGLVGIYVYHNKKEN